MDCNLTDVQDDLRKTYRAFFEAEVPISRVRAAEPLGFDEELWRRTVDIGMLDLVVPDAEGGAAGLVEVGIVAQEYGRSLAPIPLVESFVVARMLARVQPDLLAGADPIISASEIATVALRPLPLGRQAYLIPAGGIATRVVAFDGKQLIIGRAIAGGVRVSPKNLGSMPIGTVDLDDDAIVLATGSTARAIYEQVLDEWRILTAFALVGLSTRAVEIALDYVKIRKAFGITIGSFQTVAHHLADVTVALDGSYLLCLEAAWTAQEALSEAAQLAAMAYVHAVESANEATKWALHFHGGVGFTLECDIQLFLRRAKAWPLVLGDPRRELQVLADRLFDSMTALV